MNFKPSAQDKNKIFHKANYTLLKSNTGKKWSKRNHKTDNSSSEDDGAVYGIVRLNLGGLENAQESDSE